MADDPVVRAILEIQARSKDLNRQINDLAKVERGTEKVDKSLKKAEKSADKFGKTLTRWLGGAAIARFVTSAISKFADYERQLNTTSVEARRLGLDSDQTVAKVRNLTIAIEAQTGLLRQDTLPVYNKLLGLTGDVNAASVLLQASVGAAEGGYKDVATAASMLGGVMLGEVIEPAKSLGFEFDRTRDASEQSAEVLTALIERYTGLSGGIGDTRGALDAMNAQLNQTQMTIGERLAPAVKFLSNAFGSVIKVVKTFGALAGTAINVVIDSFRGLGDVIVKALDIERAFLAPSDYFAQLSAASAAATRDIANDIAGGTEEILSLWQEQADARLITEEELQEGLAAVVAKAGELDGKRRAERLAKEQADAEKRREQRLKFERRTQDDLLKVQIEAADEGSQERLDLELEMLARLRERAVAEARKRGADVDAVNRLFDRTEQARVAAHLATIEGKRREAAERLREIEVGLNADLLDQQIAGIEEGNEERERLTLQRLEREREAEIDKILDVLEADILAAEARGEDTTELRAGVEQLIAKVNEKFDGKVTAARKKASDKRKEIDSEEAAQRIRNATDIASVSVELARTVFGENKAVRIAEAIINTSRAVTEALPNIPLATLVAALGAAQVQKIASTDIGGGGGAANVGGGRAAGFDDPTNDHLASIAGRRWADDLLKMVTGGMHDRLRQAGSLLGADAGVGFTDSNLRGEESIEDSGAAAVNFNGPVFGGAVGIRRMSRMLSKAASRDRRRRRL